jgi:2-polyprenyl-6-methoxyphenol hydroxylase-like FAD-dependent oxidoreductase
MEKRITIAGAGIAGLTTAITLNKIGIQTTIYEAAPSIRAVGAGLVLGANAMMAFDRLDIKEEVMQRGKILTRFSIYDDRGYLINKINSIKMEQQYGVNNFAIHRAALHQLLASKLDINTIVTNKRITGFKKEQDGTTIQFQDSTTLYNDALIAADGIHSLIRGQLLPSVKPRFAGYTCWRAVVNNTDLQLNESSETWGTKGRFGIVPLAGNKVYWFACINAAPDEERFKHFRVKDLLNHFSHFHQPIPSILEATKDEDLLWNDIIDLKPINKYAFGNILLIGDAAHATTPNLGQGACQAIEDAVVLANAFKETKTVEAAFALFETKRLKKTHFITNTSWRIGKVAQIENKFLAQLRNMIFHNLPASINEKQFKKVYTVDF